MNNEKSVLEYMDEFVKGIADIIEELLRVESLKTIKDDDGRKKDSSECCRKGSFIYFLYDSNDKIIYIGETGQAVKNRLYSDGSGAHCCKNWFKEVKKIKYYNNIEMSDYYRRLLERALIEKYSPKYNGK